MKYDKYNMHKSKLMLTLCKTIFKIEKKTESKLLKRN